MIYLAIASIIMLAAAVSVYSSYFFFVLKRKDEIGKFEDSLLGLQNSQLEAGSDYPDVSIIVSTFNEANVIGRKIDNIAALNYPKQKLEVLVFDDNSSDGTADIAEKKLEESRLFGKVIRNPSRIGLNRSLNAAVAQAKNNYVCITDSDVLLEPDSLKNSVCVLQGLHGAGGVTGRIEPIFEGKGVAQKSESSYRGFYHKSMIAESALHSAFPGNGPLIVYDKSKVPSAIPTDYGSTDGNIAMNIIRKGFRFIYVPNAIIFEPVPENLGQQRLQKVRRAKRLIQVFLHNSDVSFNGSYGLFGNRIFPLKYLMLSLCPLLFLVGFSLLLGAILLSQNLLLYAITGVFSMVAIIGLSVMKSKGELVSSFGLHQLYLIAGLVSAFRKSVYWKTIDRKERVTSK